MSRALLFMALMAFSLPSPAATPEWIQDLNPKAEGRFSWRQRDEAGFEEKTLRTLLRFGVFPKADHLISGFEIGTKSDTDYEVELKSTSGAKALGVHQVFAGLQWQPARWTLTTMVGKFSAPTLASPLLLQKDFRPEGVFESVGLELWNSKLFLGFFGGQYLLDHQSESRILGQSEKSFWLFQQGLQASYRWSSELSLLGAINYYFFMEPTTLASDLAAQRGNAFAGTIGTDASVSHRWAPIEFLFQSKAQPLGLEATAEGAVAVNLRTPDKQRGFWFKTGLGRPWAKSSVQAEVGYFYLEPDLTLASLTESFLGYANRKGSFATLHYFPLDEVSVGGSYVYAGTIARSNVQSNRHELILDMEIKF